MTRGELARLCAVNPETLRYYEQRGLLPRPARTAANYRRYDESAVRRIRFIKRAQELGFTLEEVKDLLALQEREDASCDEVRARTAAKIDVVEEKIRALTAVRAELQRLTAECPRQGPISECPILKDLGGGGVL